MGGGGEKRDGNGRGLVVELRLATNTATRWGVSAAAASLTDNWKHASQSGALLFLMLRSSFIIIRRFNVLLLQGNYAAHRLIPVVARAVPR